MFPFPLAVLAGAVVEVVRRGGWPPLVGGIALAVAAPVIAILAVRTLALLARGKLLPPTPKARAGNGQLNRPATAKLAPSPVVE